MCNNIFVLLTIMFHLCQTTAQFCYGFFPAAVTLSFLSFLPFLPVGDAPSIPNTKQSSNSITCPRTQKDWDKRAYEICPDNKTLYHCLYDRNCSLVEVCRAPQGSNVEIVLLDSSDNLFFNQRQNEMDSNSLDYWMVQYPYCHKHFNTLKVEDKVFIKKVPLDYYLAWALVVVLVILIAIYFIYVNRHRCFNILQSAYQSRLKFRHGHDSDKNENVPTEESSPLSIQPSSTVNVNGLSLDHTNNKYPPLNVDER